MPGVIDFSQLLGDLKTVQPCLDHRDHQDYLQTVTKQFNAEHYWFMMVKKKDLHVTKSGVQSDIFMNDYPVEFVDDYLKNNRFQIDPVIHAFLDSDSGVHAWDELFDRNRLVGREHKQLEWAAEFGIEDGISTTVHYGEYVGFLHLAKRNGVDFIFHDKNRFFLFTIASLLVSNKVAKLHDVDYQKSRYRLTARETECLHWAGKGKTIWETSRILGLSENTVREYLTKATYKVQATNKTEAVAKALLAGLIEIN